MKKKKTPAASPKRAAKKKARAKQAPDHGRLVDLELRFMRLERFAFELSDVIAAQQKALDALTRETKRQREMLLDEGATRADERPPHY